MLDGEREFLRPFGSQKYCRTDDLFSDYEISDSLYKYASEKDHYSQAWRLAQDRVDAVISRVAQAVQQEIQTTALLPYYRPLEAGGGTCRPVCASSLDGMEHCLVLYFILNWLSIFV